MATERIAGRHATAWRVLPACLPACLPAGCSLERGVSVSVRDRVAALFYFIFFK
jgi:hypothetical protein